MANNDNLTMPQKLEMANKELVGENIEEVEVIQTIGIPQGENTSFWQNYLSAIGILFALLGVLYMGLWFMRKLGYGSAVVTSSQFSRSNLRVEAQLPLGNRRQAYVVRYMNKRLLLGVTDSNISLLSEEYLLDEDGKIMKDFEETMQNIQNPQNPVNFIQENFIAKLFSNKKAKDTTC